MSSRCSAVLNGLQHRGAHSDRATAAVILFGAEECIGTPSLVTYRTLGIHPIIKAPRSMAGGEYTTQSNPSRSPEAQSYNSLVPCLSDSDPFKNPAPCPMLVPATKPSSPRASQASRTT